jgi:hypothetical protein
MQDVEKARRARAEAELQHLADRIVTAAERELVQLTPIEVSAVGAGDTPDDLRE